jgi:uncharacterized membrane protein
MTLAFMRTLAPVGRGFFAIALVAFGLQHFVYGDFVTRVVLSWPAWIPGRAFWAYAVGAGLIAAGALLASKQVRSVALLVGTLLLLSFACLSLPVAAKDVAWGGAWTSALKALALSGGALLIAGIPAGRFFFAAFLLLSGIQHFIWSGFVATLVPAWIPGHLFWTYFAGLALIAAALGIVIPRTMRLAAALTALMIFSWVILVHLPRALAYWGTANGNETTALFEALAFTGVAILIVNAAADGSP